ncbi:hypothetical protein SK128_028361 [Halocaridina rubra]|uniref:non-specific serine/threonine protein kinase n=1 Tax=Halocaridina rubra TaxID=373956 RepID=A0AAN8WFD3_HALRR
MMFWKEVKRVRKGEYGGEERVKGADGQLLVDVIKVRERWAEYFKNLLNEEDDREAEIVAVANEWRMPMLDENDRDIKKEEVRLAPRATKTGKAPGIDCCHVECLSKACLESHLEPLGILVLERQVLVSQKGDLDAKPPLRKKMKTEVKESSDASLWLNMAELYRSLDMWDVVCGIVQEKLGNIKPETCRALEAEAINNPTQAFVQYRTALRKEEWEEEPSLTEKRIWEDWYLNCAGMLGQWSEMEKFLEERFLKDHDGHVEVSRVWNVARPTSVILPAMIQSKLMNILDGSDNDGNLFEFIKASMEDTHHRLLMENTFPLQMAVLAVYQEKMPRAEVYLNSTMSHTLHAISQYSILTPKPLKATLRNAQLLTELDDFLKASKQAISDADPFKVKKSIETWKNRNVNTGDNPVLIQCLASYRDLYLHHLDNQIELIPEEFNQVMRDIKVATHRAVVESSLQNFNYHLADRHLRKLKVISNDPYSLAQFYFLMTENHMLRAKNNPFKSLQYLVEAWARFMGKVSTMPVLNEAAVDAQYLRLESLLCYSICEAIDEMGYEWAPDSQYMRILADKFPTPQSKETWYTELLKCSFNSLIKAVDLTENQMLDDVEPNESSHKKVYRTLAKYCDDCLEKWENRINSFEYSKYLVIATLKGMMVGDTDAQYHFPRLINLLEENPLLIDTFKSYAEKVPTWMFLLWLNHILIYIDKAPGPALQPLIENLANEYPQAVVYPFGVSVQQYNLTTKTGKLALPICNRVKSVLNRNPLFQEFISSTSLVVAPYIECKDALRSLVEVECGKEEIEAKLKVIEETLFKVNVRSTRRTSFERGEAYIKLDRMRKLALEAVNKSFGENFKKLNSMSVKDIKEQLKVLYSLFKPTQEDQQNLPRQLKSYSPWLASFQASKYPDILELPGQYSGLSKPLPEYHVKISSFDDNLLLMKSMRVPVRITVRGDDERDYKFLVKWGEDLRTDQRMEQAFALMNAIYSSSPLCSNLTSRPSLDTYQVIPLSVQVGLLQWVEATMPLKDFISDSYKANEMKAYDSARETFGRVRPWEPSEKTRAKDIVKIYGEVVNMIPWDILRRGFVKLASDSTGFFSLRSAFAVSYATLCISHWILGIGDRHCSNSLINLKTGCVVGIDFGHHFESATQVLPFPELMPFRLSPQIVNVFQPVGASGMLKQIMIAALGSLRNSRQLLISFLEAFVKEPTDDWINFVRMLQGSTDDGQVELYSNERIRLLKAKLNGINPAHITSWALKQNRSMKRQPRVLSSLLEVIAGSNKNDLRSQLDADQLTSCQQVDILLSLACDPNILGRTWIGWDSFL